jgi:hypothetical protein
LRKSSVSSILYVEVAEKHADTMTLLLVEIQSGFVFCESPTLALQLLLESWERMLRGSLYSHQQVAAHGGFYCPFSAEEARTRAARSPIRDVAEGARVPEHSPLSGIEFFFDQAFVEENAPRYIVSTEVLETRHLEGLCGDPLHHRHHFAPHGECRFGIRVADPRWLDHLGPGVCWDTTAFPYERG